MSISDFVLNPVTLMMLVFGIVEMIKKLGATGNILILYSVLTGVVLGVVYQLSLVFPAAAVYIDIGFFGIAVGLAASGFFNFIDNRLPSKTP